MVKLLNTMVQHTKKSQDANEGGSGVTEEVNTEDDFGHFRSSEQHADGTNYQVTRWVQLPISVP